MVLIESHPCSGVLEQLADTLSVKGKRGREAMVEG